MSIHQIFAQENVSSGDFGKSSRRLPIDKSLTYKSNSDLNSRKVLIEDTPDEFLIKKPVNKDKNYDDFLSFLYRHDKNKSKAKREVHSDNIENGDYARGKRMIVFR